MDAAIHRPENLPADGVSASEEIPELEFLRPVVESGRWGIDSTGGLPLERNVTVVPRVAEALGVEQARAAAEFAYFQGLDHAVPVANGTRALVIALMAASVLAEETGKRALRPGRRALVSGLTWQATAMAPLDRRLVPVLLDVDPATGVVAPETVHAALRDDRDGEIAAVVIPHLYCRMADIPRIAEICDEYGVVSIEDCAHAHGGAIDGRPAGGVADFGTWSFQGSKSITAGEGGMVTTRHAGIVDQIVSITTCGRAVGRSRPFQAGNDRLGALQAAVLRARMRRFYREELPVKPGVLADLEARISGMDGVTALAPQLRVGTQITYKAVARFEPEAFGADTVEDLADALHALLGVEVATLYDPLDDSDLYRPDSDPANHWSDAFTAAADPARYPLPGAHELRRTALGFEHAALRDPAFPDRFAQAVARLRAAGPVPSRPSEVTG
jgi:dTDP-4-amino-4,6-dideoxygalactose transaminase